MPTDFQSQFAPRNFWTATGRLAVFILAASSIWCLLAEFYGLCSMRTFTLQISIPALIVLVGLALADGAVGNGRLWRAVLIGSIAGLLAAIAYDVFRLPFVFAEPLGIEGVVPALKLFKVFPRFGAMILGQPIEQGGYSLAAHLIGWTYHFSNGLTFGVMYLAAVGDATKRSWLWAVAMAVGLELAMLFTPYPKIFGIGVTPTFITVTMCAHLIFGVALGLIVRRFARGNSTG